MKKTSRRLVMQGVRKPQIVWWVDGSFNLISCEGRIGYEVQVLDADDVQGVHGVFENLPTSKLVAWSSQRCKRKLCSTTAAELMALVAAVKKAPEYIRLVQSLWGVQPNIIFLTDSQGALGWLRKRKAEKDPAMQGYVELVCERIEEMKAEVLWVDTKVQRADRQTKLIVEK